MKEETTESKKNKIVLTGMQTSPTKPIWKFGDLQLIDLSATHCFLWVCDQFATETFWLLIN